MRITNFLDKNKKIISTILCAAVIYGRNNFGTRFEWALVANVIIDTITFCYCIYLAYQDPKYTKKTIYSLAVFWAILFLGLQEGYHFNGMGYIFSNQIAFLTIGAAILVYFILRNNKGYILEIMTWVSEIVIMGTFLASLYLDRWAIGWWLDGEPYRVGTNFNYGNVIEVANLYLLMIVPIMYRMIVEKKIKRYLPITLITFVMVFLSATKATIAAIAIIFVYLLLFSAKTNKEVIRNLVIVVVLGVVGIGAMLLVPFFYSQVGSRMVELVKGLLDFGNTNFDLTTSTGQRMAAIHAALEHWNEKPIFGHGFYNFCQQPYSFVEGHILSSGEIQYDSMQIHMNFVEILFSFGIVGIVVYYWFPCYLFIKTLKCPVKNTRLIVISILIAITSMNLGLDMYYKYIIPYLAYFACYCLLKEAHEK